MNLGKLPILSEVKAMTLPTSAPSKDQPVSKAPATSPTSSAPMSPEYIKAVREASLKRWTDLTETADQDQLEAFGPKPD
jgi:oligoendopeptidase F